METIGIIRVIRVILGNINKKKENGNYRSLNPKP